MRQSLQELLGEPTGLMDAFEPSQGIEMDVADEDMDEDFFELDTEDDAFNEYQVTEPDFQRNLALDLADSELDVIANELLEDISDDEESRQPWMDMMETYREYLATGNDDTFDQPFPGSSTVVYPMITEAQIQFHARALPEIYPNDPVKAVIIGRETPELEAQRDRVEDTMNYQITYQDPGNRKDFSKMMWWLPITGSAFRHVFHDALYNMNKVRFVPVENLLVPYGTTCLEDAARINYRFFDTKNDLLKLMNMGFYMHVSLEDDDVDEDDDGNAPQRIRDEYDGLTRNGNTTRLGQTCYNVYRYYDLPGFEDVDEDGEPTGIALPYVFTVHARSRQILAIRRNWKEDDSHKRARIWFAHYKYQEGPGFYGAGLPHLIGALQVASTGMLRSVGDSLAFSMLQGGWKLKDAKFSGSETFAPGKFQDVDCTLDDINKSIKIAQFAPPPNMSIEYVQLLASQAQKIVSTQDILTGEQSSQNSPVGSTLAIIEQAQKVITGQHKSLYGSLSEELRILAELNYDYLPDEEEYEVIGKTGIMRRSDFDGRVDVIPTADPSVASFQQRQAIDQMCLQLSQMPQFAPFFRDNSYELLQRILKNAKVPMVDEIVYTEEEVKQKEAQKAQNPPPPPPEVIKAQSIQKDTEIRAQTAQAEVQLEAKQHADFMALEERKLQLEEKKVDMDTALKAEANDIKAGTLSPLNQQALDDLMLQLTQHIQQQMSVPQMQMQQQPMQQQQQMPMPQQQQDSMPMQEELSVPQQQQQPINPEKRNILMRLMDKIRRR